MSERDYLAEAVDIIAGKTMLLPQREHLLALWGTLLRFSRAAAEQHETIGRNSQSQK